MKLSEIHINPSNPRTIKDERFKKLVKSIDEFPKMMALRPIIIDADGMILGGNMRFKALKELKYKDIPDEWVKRASELTDEEKQRFIIEDNVPFGEWDWDTLANEWDAEQLTEWGLEIPDFAVNKEATEDDYEVPDEIKTDIVLGDLFEIGPHRLLCGDSTDSEVWDKLQIQKGTICFTSPPYNVGKSAKLSGNTNARHMENFYGSYNDDNVNYHELIQGSLSNALIFTEGACFNVQPLANNKSKLLRWLVDNENSFVDIITWDKGQGTPPIAQGVLSSRYEWLCIFNKENNSRRIPLSSWRGTISNVYSGPPQRHNEFSQVHAATFPIHLPSFIVADLMNRCTGVIDCFIGTGTTMVAAHQLGRKCYGIEIDPKYCQVIVDRMKKLDPALVIKRNGKTEG